MGRLFGTNGIRGIFPDELGLQFIHDITLSIATYFGKGPILVGYDGRISSKLIAKLVCSTLNEAGLDCANGGLVPTPALEYATKKLKYAGGIMITASHNPPEYNGLKPVAADGVEIPREDESVIEDIYFG
ncbi:MAG: phosphoglucosamine mutase, partial [Candidatus Nitrosotenuis sp.]